MSSVIHIKTHPSLSTKNSEFTKLIQIIEKLKTELKQEEQKLEIFLDYHIKSILPIKKEKCKIKLELVYLLDEFSENSPLPKTVINQLGLIIPEMLAEIFTDSSPDNKTKAIYEKWTSINYDQMQREEKKGQMEKFSDFMRLMGIELHIADLDLDDPGSLKKFHRRVKEAKEKLAQKEEVLQSNKKKTKKQLAAADISKMQDELKNKNLRSVYLSLAKIIHPDSETDLELKLEKEEVMKQVTKAYEDKDIITMLVIETQWLKNTEVRLANIKEDVAIIYIQLLKEQAKKLRQQKAELRYHSRFEHVSSYLGDKLDCGILRLIAQKESLAKECRNTKKEIEIIKTSPRNDFKKFIKILVHKYYKDNTENTMEFINSSRYKI